MDTGLTSDFINSLKEEAAKYGEDVLSGKCKDFETYKYKVGYIQGLKMAEDILHETIKFHMNRQDID